MIDSFVIEFFLASILMGSAIGLDAAIVTGLRAKAITQSKIRVIWISAITLTHTLFPMLGYLLSYYGVKQFPLLTPLIGLLAFSLITHFLLMEIKSSVGQGNKSNSSHSRMVNVALIMTVSWDALWSGPAKSAQVIQWPELAIWSSFILVGMTVASLILIAFSLSKRIAEKARLTTRCFVSKILQWVQFSIIGYFGILALTKYTLAFDIPAFYILIASFVLMAVIISGTHRHVLIGFEK